MANHIECSNYFDKFSLLTHTHEQYLYFDNFFYDKCTCSKASMPRDAGTTGAAGASAPHAFCIHNFLGAVRVQTMGATSAQNT